MKQLALLTLLLLTAACDQNSTDQTDAGTTGADVDFSGTFNGPVTQTATCSDGSQASVNASLSWVLADTGTNVSATFSGQCSPIGMTGTNILTMAQKDCGETSDNTQDISVASGTLQTTDGGVQVSFVLHSALTQGGTCDTTIAGTLTKQ